jgi:hypothetical protein
LYAAGESITNEIECKLDLLPNKENFSLELVLRNLGFG